MFGDTPFVKEHGVCNINSINWARVMIQIAHYIFIYNHMKNHSRAKVEIVVPTGACGNIAAGFIARKMGFDMQIVAAVNENDIVSRFLTKGDFSVSKEVVGTWASAMDIQIPYNVERILLAATGINIHEVGQLMFEFDRTKKVQIPAEMMAKVRQVITGEFLSS